MNLVFFVSVITALAISLSAENYESRGRIFNGQDVEHNQYKFMAFLIPEKHRYLGLIRRSNICGGAIIAPNWVLTAAHCVHGMTGINIYLGSPVPEDATNSYTVSKYHFIVHPLYSKKQLANDIALIQIPKTLKCDNIEYARLPLVSSEHPASTYAYKTAFVMGWGRIKNDGEYPDRLQKAKVKTMSLAECRVVLPYADDKDICVRTSPPFGSICKGDSGGPLIFEESGEVIGVASFMATDSCEDEDPNIFVRVTSYLPWIIENIGQINS